LALPNFSTYSSQEMDVEGDNFGSKGSITIELGGVMSNLYFMNLGLMGVEEDRSEVMHDNL